LHQAFHARALDARVKPTTVRLSIAPAKTTPKIVMARLDRAIQGQAHQAFVARPLDCPIKSGNDDKDKKAILRFRVSSPPKRQNRASQRCFLRFVHR
jgi:hypothetical protein